MIEIQSMGKIYAKHIPCVEEAFWVLVLLIICVFPGQIPTRLNWTQLLEMFAPGALKWKFNCIGRCLCCCCCGYWVMLVLHFHPISCVLQ